jgi:uncharacterized RDD family membrane protein YckC
MEKRNPYLLLGVPYGTDRGAAARAYARAVRRARGATDSPVTLEDLSWALHEIEKGIADPELDLRYLRIPALPDAYIDPRADPVLTVRTPPLERSTVPGTTASWEQLATVATIVASQATLTRLAKQLGPPVLVPDAPPLRQTPDSNNRQQSRARHTPPSPAATGPPAWSAAAAPGIRRPEPPRGANSGGFDLATVGLRLAARGADLLLVGIAIAILSGGSSVVWATMTSLAYFGYSVALESTDGRTLGKRLFDLRVIGPAGNTISAEDAAKRNALFLLGIIPFVGWVLALLAAGWAMITAASRPQSQGFHDSLVGTVVVKEGAVASS